MVIRRARLTDLAPLAALERAAFVYPWGGLDLLVGFLPGGRVLVAERGGQVAGYALCRGRSLVRLTVFPAYRRQGVARALVQAVLRPGLQVQVRASNPAARALYAGLGVAEVGTCRYRDGEAGIRLRWG